MKRIATWSIVLSAALLGSTPAWPAKGAIPLAAANGGSSTGGTATGGHADSGSSSSSDANSQGGHGGNAGSGSGSSKSKKKHEKPCQKDGIPNNCKKKKSSKR